MKKLLLSTLITSTFALSTQAVELLPVLNDNYTMNPEIALSVGGMKVKDFSDKSELLYGVELSMDCILLQTEGKNIKQHIELTSYNHDDLKITQATMSPYYHVAPFDDDFSIGFGPSFGIANVDALNKTDTIFTYGAGVSIGEDFTKSIFYRVDLQYHLTTKATLEDTKYDFNNYSSIVKLGYRF